VKRLVLPVIPATSPTLAEMMRACRLRAGISRSAGTAAYVLGNPRAWLGTAYHEVLEEIATMGLSEDPEAAAERIWSRAIAAQHQRSLAHPLDRRFGSPETWPGYHLARASSLLRARELVLVGGAGLGTSTEPGASGEIRERQFTAFEGKLLGKPDVIRPQEVVD
jgi:hypothetical protein